MAFPLPRSIVLAPHDNTKYLSYVREGGQTGGFLKFFETQAVSPYATFDVEISSTKGLVHIRSRRSNKYWQRTKSVSATGNVASHWVAATADNKEEDQSKESCTLFKFIPIDRAEKTVRIVHVQSGCNLCLWEGSDPTFDRCVSAVLKEYNCKGNDTFKIVDCKSLLVLPKYVAFKGYNNMYLGITDNHVAFSENDIGHLNVAWETFVTDDGHVRIKSNRTNKFWGLVWEKEKPYIQVGFDDTSSTQAGTLFRPVKVDDKTIALRNLKNSKFGTRVMGGSNILWFGPNVETVNKEARLTLEEPVLSLDIYDVTYHLQNSRVYDQTTFMVAKNYASNFTDEPTHMDVKLTYENVRTSVWKRNLSVSSAMQAKTEFNIPIIIDGRVELSAEFHDGVRWEETETRKTVTDIVHKVVVPKMTKVTVNLIATRAKCDVPFSFMQSATLYDGTVAITEVEGATYTGSNYYSIHFETEEEKLKPKEKKTEPEGSAGPVFRSL